MDVGSITEDPFHASLGGELGVSKHSVLLGVFMQFYRPQLNCLPVLGAGVAVTTATP